MEETFWVVDEHRALTSQVRTFLQATYGYTAPAEHTYAALVSIRRISPAGVTCVTTFPFTFVLAGAQAGDTESSIDAACRARLLAIRNAEPLASIVGRRHAL